MNTDILGRLRHPFISLYSMTGSEIYKVQKQTAETPNLIVSHTNKRLSPIVELFNLDSIFLTLPNKPTVEDYERVFFGFKNPIITLHGFLRVIPPEICEKYTIFNMHPGLITKYPELKGLDPQKRAVELKHEIGGCVIHRVTSELDGGEIIFTRETPIKGLDEQQVTILLKALAQKMWTKLLSKALYT